MSFTRSEPIEVYAEISAEFDPIEALVTIGAVGADVTVAEPIEVDVLIGASELSYLYVVDSGNNRVQAFDYQGNFKFSFGSYGIGNGQFISPYGITTDGTYVYVTDTGNNRVQYFTPEGVYVGQWGSTGTDWGKFESPKGIATDGRYVYVVDQFNHRFQIFGMGGLFVYGLGEYGSGENQFAYPTDIAVDALYIYIDDAENGRIVIYEKAFVPQCVIDADLPGMTSELTTHVSPVCAIDADLPAMTADITATVSAICAINADLPGIYSEIETLVRITAVIDADLPGISSDIRTEIHFTAVIDADLPGMTSEITTVGVVTAVIDADLPGMTSEITTRILTSGTFVTAVINTLRKAVTEYTAFEFNSYADFDGKQLAAHSDGNIYELTGEDDAGTAIAAAYKSADIDLFGKTGPVRMGDILVHRQAADDIILTLQGDRDTNKIKTYDIPGSGDALPHTRRAKAPRGAKWRIVSVKVGNKDGSDLEVNQIMLNKAGESNRWT